MRLLPLSILLTLPALIAAPKPSSMPLSFSKLRFEPADHGFIARGLDYRLSLTAHSVELSGDAAKPALRMNIEGASAGSRIEGLDQLASQTSYFLGDSSRWQTAVPNYARVRVAGVYRGVDLVFYGSDGALEFDFVVAPGADARMIRLRAEGAARFRIEDGALILARGKAQVRWSRPVVYQSVNGERQPVKGRFVLEAGNRARFEPGSYDHSRALVIDPVLSFSTYLGSIGNEAARGVGVDGAGNIYVTGYTTSRNLPVSASAVQAAYGGQTAQYQTGDALVAKFSPSGSLLALTYLGGSRDDLASSLAVDSAGNVYITGYTNSPDFPFSARAYQPRMAGGGGNTLFTVGDAFVVKLNSNLSQIMYSTCLGGTRDEAGIALAIDSSGSAYVTGITLSTDFPTTTGAYQTAFRGMGGQPITDFGTPFFITGDAFVSKLSPDGSQLLVSTYLGGTLDDAPTAIAVDSGGNIYIGGFTISRNFPTTTNALQTTYAGADFQQNEFYSLGDGFLAKLNPTGTSLIYSTYLGGAGDDAVAAIAVDSAGNVYATGATTSSKFPVTTGAFRTSNSGPLFNSSSERIIGDAFAVKLKPDGSGLVYGTYIGGSGDDSGKAIAVDSAGNAYIAGSTASPNFPLTTDATQKVYAGSGGQHNNNDAQGDGFVVELDPTGAREIFSTFYGGAMDDGIQGVVLDAAGSIYVTGVTMSSNLPTSTNAYQARYGGAGSSGRVLGDAFVAKFVNSSSFTAAPAGVNVSYALGAAKPSPVTVSLTAAAATSFTVTSSATWVTVSPVSGQTPASLAITVDPSGFQAGTYNATVTISGASASTLQVPVALTVTGAGTLPSFTAAGVINSASGISGTVSAGEIVTMFGSAMGPAVLVTLQLADDGRVASLLAGTRVLFDGVPAPLIYTSAGQVSCVVPYSVGGKTTTQVQVSYNGILSAPVTLNVAPAAPGLYTANLTGTGQAAALNQDNSYNTSTAPAAVGGVVVLFGTGEGLTAPAVPDGTVANTVVPKPTLPVSATVAGRPAEVAYGGTAPGFVAGALQVNVVIPEGTPSGNAEVIITVGTVQSRAGVTVAVK